MAISTGSQPSLTTTLQKVSALQNGEGDPQSLQEQFDALWEGYSQSAVRHQEASERLSEFVKNHPEFEDKVREKSRLSKPVEKSASLQERFEALVKDYWEVLERGTIYGDFAQVFIDEAYAKLSKFAVENPDFQSELPLKYKASKQRGGQPSLQEQFSLLKNGYLITVNAFKGSAHPDAQAFVDKEYAELSTFVDKYPEFKDQLERMVSNTSNKAKGACLLQ
jgi:hypothetical protein